MTKALTDNYDDEPVVYCANCYSLKIVYEEAIDADCCMECGCCDILSTTIDEWEKLYERKYGHKYLEINNNPRNSLLFKMSVEELKTYVYNSSQWKSIVMELYPKFPGGLSRIDSVILLFDKLIKDHRLDELRMFLYKLKDNK